MGRVSPIPGHRVPVPSVARQDRPGRALGARSRPREEGTRERGSNPGPALRMIELAATSRSSLRLACTTSRFAHCTLVRRRPRTGRRSGPTSRTSPARSSSPAGHRPLLDSCSLPSSRIRRASTHRRARPRFGTLSSPRLATSERKASVPGCTSAMLLACWEPHSTESGGAIATVYAHRTDKGSSRPLWGGSAAFRVGSRCDPTPRVWSSPRLASVLASGEVPVSGNGAWPERCRVQPSPARQKRSRPGSRRVRERPGTRPHGCRAIASHAWDVKPY